MGDFAFVGFDALGRDVVAKESNMLLKHKSLLW